MIRCFLLSFTALVVSGCATVPSDPAAALLEPAEQVELRLPATLMHGHDMEEPPYDTPDGYRPIPTYGGELLLTDRRLLFVELPPESTPSYLSMPYAAVARARPSRSPLLHYVVVWDADGHPDSFVVDSSDVTALHQQVGRMLMRRPPPALSPTSPASPLPPVPTRHQIRPAD